MLTNGRNDTKRANGVVEAIYAWPTPSSRRSPSTKQPKRTYVVSCFMELHESNVARVCCTMNESQRNTMGIVFVYSHAHTVQAQQTQARPACRHPAPTHRTPHIHPGHTHPVPAEKHIQPKHTQPTHAQPQQRNNTAQARPVHTHSPSTPSTNTEKHPTETNTQLQRTPSSHTHPVLGYEQLMDERGHVVSTAFETRIET